ncbi:hypothetical protein ACH5RR_023847 [Cinchona calisaya]|uniref:Uncharacterized protein n=1 Tax=Cinchona calisaya TaxID=153742 RepID=A0ABD2ZF94_9GENT
MQATPSSKSKTTYQKFVFADSKGSKVQAIIFNQAISIMSHKLQVYKTYKISNAEFRSNGIEKQWVISTETVLEEVTEEQNKMLTAEFNYTEFRDFAQYVDSKNHTVDVLGVVIDALSVFPVKKEDSTSYVQKFVLINEEFDIDLTNKSGTITASVFADLGETLLGFSTLEAMKSSVQNKELPLEKIHEDLKSKIFIVQTFELGVAVPTENLSTPIQTAVLKFSLEPSQVGKFDVFANLPGSPDNIKRNYRGEFWVAVNSHDWDNRYELLVKLSQNGNILKTLKAGDGETWRYSVDVAEKNGSLWIGSVVESPVVKLEFSN